MIDTLVALVGSLFLLFGAVIVMVGGIGMLRLPDFFCRLHGAGVIDTLGAWSVLIGLIILAPSFVVAFKVFMIAVLIFFLSPVSSHILAKTAVESGAALQPDIGANKLNIPDPNSN